MVTPLAGQEAYFFNHLRVQDGLSQAENAFVYKDSKGFVWISSLTGLNRFDGSKVRVYLPDVTDPSGLLGDNIQSSFFEDTANDIWFCTYHALHKYNRDQDCFDHYQVHDPQGQPVIGYYVFHLDPVQNLWFLADGQLMYTLHIPTGEIKFRGNVRPGSVRCYVESDSKGYVSRILLRSVNALGIDVIELDRDLSIRREFTITDIPISGDQRFRKAIFEKDNSIWILLATSLVKYSWTNGPQKEYSIPVVNDMERFDDSTFLLASQQEGLLWFHTTTGEISPGPQATTDISPKGQLVSANYIDLDRDRTLWACITGQGIMYTQLKKRKFYSIQLDHTGEFFPIGIYEQRPNTIWCFTRTNLFEIDISREPYEFKRLDYPMENQQPLHRVQKDANGRYWLSNWGGIYVFFPEENQIKQVSDTIVGTTAAALPDGRLLLTGTKRGLFEGSISRSGTPRLRKIQAVPQDKEYYPVLWDPLGRVWLNEKLNQFIVLDSGKYNFITRLPVTGYCSGLFLSPDTSTIWVCSTTGLYEIDAASLYIKNVYSPANDFPVKGIRTMVMDDNGKFWISHTAGIALFDPDTRKTRLYYHEDGLAGLEYSQASCRDSQGRLWFASKEGITYFFPDSVKDLQVSAFPQLTQLLVNDQPSEQRLVCLETGAANIAEIKKLRFNYQQNTLTFVVNALEYSTPHANKIIYSMEGLDDHQVVVENARSVRYPNIPPGQYRFVFYATNSDGVMNPVPHTIAIEITPPYYKTWWFLTLVALFSIFVIAYIMYLRFSKAIEVERVRLKLYENLHDDVGSRLTAIVLGAEEIEHHEEVDHRAKAGLISAIAKNIIENMRRLIWAIDPENDTMLSVSQKITYDASLLLNDSIDFSVEVDPILHNFEVSGELRYQISAICNEAFSNISKYAQASRVRVTIARVKDKLQVVITDNGRGFAMDAASKDHLKGSGYGLENMKRRASRAGGELSLYSKPGEGATVTVNFPYSP